MDQEPLPKKLVEAMTPGHETTVAADEAELLGAFVEDALSAADARTAAAGNEG